MSHTEKIDFVILWVDGNDPDWRKSRAEYSPEYEADDSESRYRDWDLLRYWFRGVEKFAPWVNRVWFVTCGHLPDWLNTEHEKLTVVRHDQYLKQEYLPTFSSHPLELNLHRIEGLSEKFVYFNDDMFLIDSMREEDFFRNGLPRDCAIETALMQDDIDNPFAHILMNTTALVNMHYQKHDIIRKRWKQWFHPAYGAMLLRNVLMLPYSQFSGFKYTHLPSPFLKSTFEKVWEAEGGRLDQLCHNRFRTAFDVNQYVMKYWQYMEGNFVPQTPKIGRFCIAGRDDEIMLRTIEEQQCKMICVNDSEKVEDFEKMKSRLGQAFDRILPETSGYEL